MKKEVKIFEKEMVDKINKGEKLTEDEIQEFLWDCGKEIYEESDGEGRWYKYMFTVKEISNRFFAVMWQKGLTEMQPNEYPDQPFEVEKHEYEETVIMTEWKGINLK